MHKCRSCNSQKINLILDLGNQPWCNDFLAKDQLGHEEIFPLRLCYCESCELLQLDYTVPKEKMFLEHQYLSGITQTLIKHFYETARENKQQFKLQSKDLIIDIGGNDGSQLMQYQKLGLTNVVNVESASNICKISKDNDVPTLNVFFNTDNIKLNFSENTASLINASGVFFHLEELHSVINAIKYVLSKDGVFIIQFMYAGAMIENDNFDTIYHEHLCYYTLRSLINLMKPYELDVFDAYQSDIHSGSIIAKVCHSDSYYNIPTERFIRTLKKDHKYTIDKFFLFAETVKNKKNDILDLLTHLKDQGKKVYAYGAPAKGNTLLNYCGINHNHVIKAVEVNRFKIGKYLPGSHIPIVEESEKDIPDYYLLLSHNFVDEILAKNKHLLEKGVKFILPFPNAEIIDG